MPSYLDFNSTSALRNFLIGRTLQQPNGPQTFTASNYSIQNTSDYSNVDPGAVDTNRANDLLQIKTSNVFKPLEYFIKDTIDTFPRRANLALYPYFTYTDHNLIGIMSNSNYDTESELFKFAANNLRTNPNGPVYARIAQNLETVTNGKNRLLDALNGNTATAINLVTGREPLIEFNNKITVAKTLPGKGVDFLESVAGLTLPFAEIPGDYLSNPANPVNYRPEAKTGVGKFVQDMTGVLGSLIGIQRRPKLSRKPSDLFIEYLGEGQKQALFNNLSFSKYAPDYTTSARSQQSSKLFAFADKVAESAKSLLGIEAPKGTAYIGDDRGNDVKFAMGDFNDRQVRSNYFLSLMFDEEQAKLFQRKRNITEGGSIGGKLTWISAKSKNKLGVNNAEYSDEASALQETLSTQFGFREDSILSSTQQLLDTMPTDGGAARSHVANVIDQTSRIFREGDVMLSRGSAIKYTDKFGEETGVEYCRVWTKDRSYLNYSDTMKRTGIIRKFEGSVMGGNGSKPWNLNIGPMSNGVYGDDFSNSSNIFPGGQKDRNGKDFYAKKYMFSIENLAWKSSKLPGFTVQDLPYCERGPNGGRVMWFAPYDLKVSESNSARWEANNFLGRPEPIYTYQNTERSGQIGFKVVVDHPSIMNLLVREYFKGMSDEEADNYINAVFAGCKDLDFYGLIRRFTTLDSDDVKLINDYLNQKGDPQVIKSYKTVLEPPVKVDPGQTPTQTGSNNVNSETQTINVRLHYENDYPKGPAATSGTKYTDEYNRIIGQQTTYINGLTTDLTTLYNAPANSATAKADKTKIAGTSTSNDPVSSITQNAVNKLTTYFTTLTSDYTKYDDALTKIKQGLSAKTITNVEIKIDSSTSSIASPKYNEKLSLRRSHSVLNDIFDKISNGAKPSSITWVTDVNTELVDGYNKNGVSAKYTEGVTITSEYKLKDFGYPDNTGTLKIVSKNYGELFKGTGIEQDCVDQDFKYVKDLSVKAPISFYCRKSEVEVKYSVTPLPPPPPPPPPPQEIQKSKIVSEDTIVPGKVKKPSIDVMKRIIMKTLSECYYFKILEESSPIAFKSLREKLKYFHPGFHSTTPEGLNARLTFLHQCIRPGDTIPIKGVADEKDLNARNTSFGPPPICILRVGDFYNSKVVIKDVNITFDDSVWDLNPEGIGVQPMIANVQLSVNFIGGQGLERPVERLQNALSSNFYANTEIYDERAIATNTKIDGKNAEDFTKEFLQDLLKEAARTPTNEPEDSKNVITEGEYIGNPAGSFTQLINDVFTATDEYFKCYTAAYNNIIKLYGNNLGSIFLSSNYRTIKDFDVYDSVGSSSTIQLFGLYPKTNDISVLIRGLRSGMISNTETINLCQMFGFDTEMTGPKIDKANELLKPYLQDFINARLDAMTELNLMEDFETTRDNLIKSLDPVNVIVKYGFYDYKIDKTKVTEATLSGFTYDKLYNEYKSCITYIKDNTSKMYDDLDTSVNYNSSTLSSTNFTKIISIMYQSEQDRINLMTEVFETDTTIFTERLRKRLKKKLDDFATEPDTKKFHFSKFRKRSNSKEIKFSVQSESETTDAGKVDDVKKLKSTIVSVTNKLNFYKK